MVAYEAMVDLVAITTVSASSTPVILGAAPLTAVARLAAESAVVYKGAVALADVAPAHRELDLERSKIAPHRRQFLPERLALGFERGARPRVCRLLRCVHPSIPGEPQPRTLIALGIRIDPKHRA